MSKLKKIISLLLLCFLMVTCSSEAVPQNNNTLHSYSLETITIGQDYQSILAVNEDIWVLKSGMLSQLRGNTFLEKKDFVLPVHSLDDTAMIWDGEFIWITAYLGLLHDNQHWLGKFDIHCWCIASEYFFDKPTEPFDIAVGGNALWISFRVHTSQATNYSVSKFDIDAGTIEYDIELGNSFPSQVAWHDNQLWILDSTNNLALIYNDMTGIIISTYQTGLNPSGIAFSETHAWITNKGDFFITTVPLLGSKSIKNINVNCWTFPDCTLDGIVIKNNQAIIYSTTYQKVYRIDLQTYQTVNEYDIRVPKDITVLKDQIFVLNGNRSRNDIGRTMTIIKP